ncbi:MAG: Hpt domain-containing protein [Pseudomonadota bacterium]
MSIFTFMAADGRNSQQRQNDRVCVASPINYEHLHRYTLGDQRIEHEILQLFAEQLPQYIGQLQRAGELNDINAWLEVTHALKGAAQAVGATVLAQRAAEAEQAADRCSRFDTSKLAAAIACIIAHIAQEPRVIQTTK